MAIEQIAARFGLSELQFALGVIGILILILVALINLRSARSKRQARLHVEPVMGNDASHADELERLEPVFSPETSAHDATQKRFAIDPRIDCVITLRFEAPIKGSEILAELSDWPRFSADWICDGLRADGAQDQWGSLDADVQYAGLQLAMQLASRRGPVGVLELSDFCSRSQALADVLGAQIDMPSVSAMLESAKELDAIAAESDIQLSINIAFDGKPKTRAELDAMLRDRHFMLSSNGRFYEFLSHDQALFTTGFLDSDQPVTGISLLLEVPLIAQEQMGFERMLAEGVALAESAHGRLVDDNGVNLTENAVIAIRQHLDGLYVRLEQSGIPAGSSTATRLFS